MALAFATLPPRRGRRSGAAPSAAAQRLGAGDPMPTDPRSRAGRLANGLSYYVLANKKPEKRAELRLVVKAGSILEEDDQQGLAHFVEHMAFNGTKNFPKHEIVVVPRVARHAVRRRRQRLHQLRRNGVHAARSRPTSRGRWTGRCSSSRTGRTTSRSTPPRSTRSAAS